MNELEPALSAQRASLADFIAAAEARETVWTTPRAPGKWSPAQVVEHVARSLDESANEVAGTPTKFPHLPFFLRPVAKGLLFNRVLSRRAFPKARTSRAFNPESGPVTPAAARERLQAALERFERACRERARAQERFASVVFGEVSVVDYVRFQEYHTRHHQQQLGH